METQDWSWTWDRITERYGEPIYRHTIDINMSVEVKELNDVPNEVAAFPLSSQPRGVICFARYRAKTWIINEGGDYLLKALLSTPGGVQRLLPPNLEEALSDLDKQIESDRQYGSKDSSRASWSAEHGVLISRDVALTIREALENVKRELTTLLNTKSNVENPS